jgi:hypothetical protein
MFLPLILRKEKGLVRTSKFSSQEASKMNSTLNTKKLDWILKRKKSMKYKHITETYNKGQTYFGFWIIKLLTTHRVDQINKVKPTYQYQEQK